MNSQKSIKSYIKPGSWIKIVGFILLAAMVITLIIGIFQMTKNDNSEATPFDPVNSTTNAQTYLDIAGISSWLYQYDDAVYYTAEDTNGYFYTVRLTDAQFNEMTLQQEYWNRESEDVPAPEPYRLYGVAQTAYKDIRESLADSWSITENEYVDYFGTLYLNGTTSVSAQNASAWIFFAILFLAFGVACLATCLGPDRNAKKCLNRLEALGETEKAAEQLSLNEATVIGKDKARLTRNYLFGKKTGVAVRYEDILWCYKRTIRTNFIVTNNFLVINTGDAKKVNAINFGKSDKYSEIDKAMETIAQQNPRVLIGYTRENQQAYNEITKTV